MKKRVSFQVGDRVVRNKAVGGTSAKRGDLAGTILKVTPALFGAGGTRARIRVRWDNGHEASVEDRQIVLDEAEVSAAPNPFAYRKKTTP